MTSGAHCMVRMASKPFKGIKLGLSGGHKQSHSYSLIVKVMQCSFSNSSTVARNSLL